MIRFSETSSPSKSKVWFKISDPFSVLPRKTRIDYIPLVSESSQLSDLATEIDNSGFPKASKVVSATISPGMLSTKWKLMVWACSSQRENAIAHI
jgi:hypothetical protein